MNNPTRQRVQFAVPIKCPECGQVGSTVWEEIAGAIRPAEPERALISVSNGFHTSDTKMPSAAPEIRCDRCDVVVLE